MWLSSRLGAISNRVAGYSAIVDFILALLPWKIILGLQMKTHEKVGVSIAMSLGLL